MIWLMFTPPSPLLPSWCVWDWDHCWLQLKGFVCFHHQDKQFKATVPTHLPPLQGQDFRPVPASLLSVCPSHVLIVAVHALVQEQPHCCVLPMPHPGCTQSMGAASPSSGHGGAPARCRWSARCPDSTPKGPPYGEHSKASVGQQTLPGPPGHSISPHQPGQQCHEEPPSLPQLCHGPCPSSSPSIQLFLQIQLCGSVRVPHAFPLSTQLISFHLA